MWYIYWKSHSAEIYVEKSTKWFENLSEIATDCHSFVRSFVSFKEETILFFRSRKFRYANIDDDDNDGGGSDDE